MPKTKVSEQDIFDFIEAVRDWRGYAPSPSEVANHFEVTRQAIHYRMRNMPKLAKYPEYKKMFDTVKKEC